MEKHVEKIFSDQLLFLLEMKFKQQIFLNLTILKIQNLFLKKTLKQNNFFMFNDFLLLETILNIYLFFQKLWACKLNSVKMYSFNFMASSLFTSSFFFSAQNANDLLWEGEGRKVIFEYKYSIWTSERNKHKNCKIMMIPERLENEWWLRYDDEQNKRKV